MKNIIKKNLGTTVGISLSIVAVLSMSFTSQKSIETKTQETYFSQIENAQANNSDEAFKVFARIGAATEVANLVTGFIGGGREANDNVSQNTSYKVSTFD